MIELKFNEFLTELFKIKRFGKTPNLLVMQKILEKLGNPHKKLKFIHIAGTNGKGSVSNYINSILMENEYKVGLFTSPYIHKFNERFKINNEDIKDEELAKIGSLVFDIIKTIPYEVKQFDIITAIAMYWFNKEKCDYVVLESGMGGRNDSTNVIDSCLSVITTIDLDHTKVLGETKEEIAFEKAGIVKEGCHLIYYPTEYENILIDECKKNNATYNSIIDAEKITANDSGSNFIYKGNEYSINMMGKHQIKNACVAIEVAKYFGVDDETIKKGLFKMKFEGRFENISSSPLIYIDGGHNPQGAQSIVETVMFHNIKNPVFIVSVNREKDGKNYIKNLRGHGEIILTCFDENVCFTCEELSLNYNEKIKPADEILKEINVNEDKTYIFCGSIYQISEIKKYFDKTR